MLKKIFLSLLALLLFVILGISFILFTQSGNNLIASYIEDKVNEHQNVVTLSVKKLTLSPSTLQFDAVIDDGSSIKINGGFHVFSQDLDLNYQMKIKELSYLAPLIGQKLQGPLNTTGNVKGTLSQLHIKGNTDIAQSQTKYDVVLIDRKPTIARLVMQNAQIDQLLHLVDQPKYIAGNLNVQGQVDLSNLDQLKGNALIAIKNGKTNSPLINKEFKQNLPNPTIFNLVSKINLTGQTVIATTDMKSNIANLHAQKTVLNIKNNTLNTDYNLSIPNLRVVGNMFKQNLQGPLNTKGSVTGSFAKLHIKGDTDLAHSQTKYDVNLVDYKPTMVNFVMQNAQIDQLLYLVDQPKYLFGNLNIQGKVDLSHLDNLKGNVFISVKNGKADSYLINQEFKQNLPNPTIFNLVSKINLAGTNAIATTDIKSNVADINAQKTIFNIKNNTLNTDYNLNVPDLRVVGNMLQQKIRGAINVIGNAKFKNNELFVNGHSNTLGGKINFTLQGNQLVANLESLSLLKILHTFYYPKIFTSIANANIRYNIMTQRGDIVADLSDGRFINSNLANVIQQLAHFDITREIYQNIKLNSDINKKVIVSNLDMQSKETRITMNQGQLNLANETLNMPLNVQVKKLLFKIGLSGNMRQPHIAFDANEMVRQKAEKEIQRGLNKLIKKHPKEGEILQKTFDIFNKKLF